MGEENTYFCFEDLEKLLDSLACQNILLDDEITTIFFMHFLVHIFGPTGWVSRPRNESPAARRI